MNKEELLKKSRLENKNGDEREIKCRNDAQSYGFLIIAFLVGVFDGLAYFGMVEGNIQIFDLNMPIAIFLSLILLIGVSAEYLSKYILLKKRTYLLCFIVFAILCVLVLIVFFHNIKV